MKFFGILLFACLFLLSNARSVSKRQTYGYQQQYPMTQGGYNQQYQTGYGYGNQYDSTQSGYQYQQQPCNSNIYRNQRQYS
uniref:Uncharacterized protein n=1 Tax=Panagrolaimus sp. PS1159 TaxID=55785 RepID=A0AC35GM47_9BILA